MVFISFALTCSLQLHNMIYIWYIGPVWWNAVSKLDVSVRPTLFSQIIHWSIHCVNTRRSVLLFLYQREKHFVCCTFLFYNLKQKTGCKFVTDYCVVRSNQWFKVLFPPRDIKTTAYVRDDGENYDKNIHQKHTALSRDVLIYLNTGICQQETIFMH